MMGLEEGTMSVDERTIKAYAQAVAAAERNLARAKDQRDHLRELEDDPVLLAGLDSDVRLCQAALGAAVLLLRMTGTLVGIETEAGAVIRAWEIGADVQVHGAGPIPLTVDERLAEQDYEPPPTGELWLV